MAFAVIGMGRARAHQTTFKTLQPVLVVKPDSLAAPRRRRTTICAAITHTALTCIRGP